VIKPWRPRRAGAHTPASSPLALTARPPRRAGDTSLFGAFPASLLEPLQDHLRSVIEATQDLAGSQRSLTNAYTLYLKTRPAASSESAKRARGAAAEGPHPLLVARLPAGRLADLQVGGGGASKLAGGRLAEPHLGLASTIPTDPKGDLEATPPRDQRSRTRCPRRGRRRRGFRPGARRSAPGGCRRRARGPAAWSGAGTRRSCSRGLVGPACRARLSFVHRLCPPALPTRPRRRWRSSPSG
jgi:hypothetical protein